MRRKGSKLRKFLFFIHNLLQQTTLRDLTLSRSLMSTIEWLIEERLMNESRMGSTLSLVHGGMVHNNRVLVQHLLRSCICAWLRELSSSNFESVTLVWSSVSPASSEHSHRPKQQTRQRRYTCSKYNSFISEFLRSILKWETNDSRDKTLPFVAKSHNLKSKPPGMNEPENLGKKRDGGWGKNFDG